MDRVYVVKNYSLTEDLVSEVQKLADRYTEGNASLMVRNILRDRIFYEKNKITRARARDKDR